MPRQQQKKMKKKKRKKKRRKRHYKMHFILFPQDDDGSSLLPSNHPLRLTLSRGKVSIDELHIVCLEFLFIGDTITLTIEIIRIERLDGLQHFLVFVIVHHPSVATGAVPRVEGMVTNHGQGLIGKGALFFANVVQVFVVAPAEHDIIHAAARTVDAVFGAVDGVFAVRVVLECARVDDGVVEAAADGEGVPDDVPLPLGVVEEEEFAEIVDQAGELEPLGLSVSANGLGGLEQVLDLTERCVGVGFVDEGVEFFHGLPDGHFGTCLGFEVVACFEVVGNGLLLVLLPVEVLDTVACIFVLSELGLVLVGVELRLFVNVDFFLRRSAILDTHGGLEDVDLIDGV